MKKSHVFVLLLTSVAIVQTAFGQANYLPGSIVLQNGNQENGLIDYREWGQNPRKINFKKNEGSEVIAYTTGELASFKIDGKDSFTRAIVTKDMSPVEMRSVIEGTEEKIVVDTVFLRLLIKGPVVSLYEYVDEKPHYYVQETDAKYTELIYKVSYNTNTTSLEYKQLFRNQLQKYLPGHPQEKTLLRSLERTEYQEGDLVRVVAVINNVQVVKKKTSLVSFMVEAGPTLSSLKMGGNTPMKDFSFKAKPGFAAGVGMDIASSRNLQELVLRVELSYSLLMYEGAGPYKTYWPGSTGSYTLKQSNITPSFAILYSFIKKPAFRLFAGGGMDYSFSSYPTNTLRAQVVDVVNHEDIKEDYLSLEKSWAMISARVGAVLNNRLEIGLVGRVTGSFERFVSISAKPSIYNLRIGYRFKRKA